MADESLIRCATCREVMQREAEQSHPDGSAYLEFYACQGCQRRLAMFWELTGQGATAETQTWVEREIARRGSFFPGDFGPNRFGGNRF